MTKISRLLFVLLTFSLLSFNAYSQDDEPKLMDIPNLTAEQKTQIKEIKQDRMEKRKTLKKENQVLMEELKTLMLAETPNTTEINAKIDKIAAKKSEIFKQTALMHTDIKALLTTEQKTWYNENILSKFWDDKK